MFRGWRVSYIWILKTEKKNGLEIQKNQRKLPDNIWQKLKRNRVKYIHKYKDKINQEQDKMNEF